FVGLIADFQRLLPTLSLSAPVVADPIVGPREAVPDAFPGSLRDYSRCAALDDLGSLHEGEFPFARDLWPGDQGSGALSPFRGAIFSTSPEQPAVNWNFMDEVEIDAAGRLKSRRAIESILDALLPRPPGGSGGSDKDEFAGKLFRGWLGGFIQIAKYALGDAA